MKILNRNDPPETKARPFPWLPPWLRRLVATCLSGALAAATGARTACDSLAATGRRRNMLRRGRRSHGVAAALAAIVLLHAQSAQALERLKYNNPGLTVDLGVGLWAFPLPMDFNGDGIPDFLGGAEDGRFYYLKNPRSR